MFQVRDNDASKRSKRAWLAATAIWLGLFWVQEASATDQLLPPEKRIPRYASLASDDVKARANPEFNARIKWIYKVRGLPVQVVAKTEGWLRICDPEGNFAWVRRNKVGPQSTVMNDGDKPLVMRVQDALDAPAIGYLAPHAMARLRRCTRSSCYIQVGKVPGWVAREELWGAAKGPQCRLGAPPLTP